MITKNKNGKNEPSFYFGEIFHTNGINQLTEKIGFMFTFADQRRPQSRIVKRVTQKKRERKRRLIHTGLLWFIVVAKNKENNVALIIKED